MAPRLKHPLVPSLISLIAITVSMLSGSSCSPGVERSPASLPGSASRAVSAVPPKSVTVVALTDFHGALEPNVTEINGRELIQGGAAYLSSYLTILRKHAEGPVILVDGGDLFQGSMASNLFEGRPVVRLYNYLGMGATALGNHEFDFGPVGEHAVPMTPYEDPQGALKQRIREAKFPVLGINVRDSTGQIPSWLKGSVIYESQGVRIGVIGATSNSTPSTTNGANLRGLSVINSFEPVKREAQRLRAELKADVVIVALHDGASCGDNSLDKVEDLSTCTPGDGLTLARNLPEGLVDVIVEGHTHQGIAKRIGRTAILQSFSHGKRIGWVEVPLRTGAKPVIAGFEPVCGTEVVTPRGRTCEAGEVRNLPGAVITPARFLGELVSADSSVTALIRPELDRVRSLKNESLGIEVQNRLTRSYATESALGNLVVDTLRASIPNADVAVSNGGGLRAHLEPGPLTYGAIFNVLPFDNQLATVKINGALLAKMVQLGLRPGSSALLWSNLTFQAEGCKVKTIQVGGHPLDPQKSYTVVAPDFLANGGSDFNTLGIPPSAIQVLWDRKYILREAMVGVLKTWRRSLRAEDFFDSKAPRQQFHGPCQGPPGGGN